MRTEKAPTVTPDIHGGDLAIGKNAFEFMKEKEKSNQLFEMSYENFAGFITDLNAIVRDIPQDGSNYFDGGSENSIGGHMAPELEKKKQYMEESFTAAAELDNKKDQATLMYFSTLAAHPFVDGNGRTSRVLYEVINNPDITESEIAGLINRGGDYSQSSGANQKEQTSVDEELVRPAAMWSYISRELNTKYFGGDIVQSINFDAKIPDQTLDQLSDQDKKILSRMTSDLKLFPICLTKLFSSETNRQHFVTEEPVFFSYEGDDKKHVLEIKEGSVNALSAEDCKKLIGIYENVKDDSFNTLIDCFRNPNAHIINGVAIKDALHKENQIEYRRAIS